MISSDTGIRGSILSPVRYVAGAAIIIPDATGLRLVDAVVVDILKKLALIMSTP
jgi:hypothetical protein